MSQPSKIMPKADKKYRLITRSDMDGLVCGVLLKELGLIDEVTFAHPKDMQDGLIEVTASDITTKAFTWRLTTMRPKWSALRTNLPIM